MSKYRGCENFTDNRESNPEQDGGKVWRTLSKNVGHPWGRLEGIRWEEGGCGGSDGKLCVYVLQEEASESGWNTRATTRAGHFMLGTARVCVRGCSCRSELVYFGSVHELTANRAPAGWRRRIGGTPCPRQTNKMMKMYSLTDWARPRRSLLPSSAAFLVCGQAHCPVHKESITLWCIIKTDKYNGWHNTAWVKSVTTFLKTHCLNT